MTFHPINDVAHTEQRKRELLRQARLQHLAREVQADQETLGERLLGLVADLFSGPDDKLKARAERPAQMSRIDAAETQHVAVNFEFRESA